MPNTLLGLLALVVAAVGGMVARRDAQRHEVALLRLRSRQRRVEIAHRSCRRQLQEEREAKARLRTELDEHKERIAREAAAQIAEQREKVEELLRRFSGREPPDE